MSNLGPQQQNVSFDGLLQIPGGVTAQLQQVQDGDGNGTGLWLSSLGSNATTASSFVPSVNGTQITGAVPRLISDGFGDYVSVKDFGAIGDGSHDDTAAIQAAVNYKNGFLAIFFPPGTYKVTSTITFAYDRYYVYGCGRATLINFVPSADDVLFYVEKGDLSSSVQNTFRDLTFYSSNATYTKIAFEVIDQSQCVFENLHTTSPHWYGGTSTFLWVKGRDTTTVKGLNAYANLPLRISPIPGTHSGIFIGLDHWHFSDLYIASPNAPLITIDSGTNLTNVTFDGYQAWVLGTYGVYWNDTTSSAVSYAVSFKNVRWEQAVGAAGYCYYLSHNTGLQQLRIENSYATAEANCLYFRRVNNYTIDGLYYIGHNVAADIDATCNAGVLSNVRFNAIPATISIVNNAISGHYWYGGNIYSFIGNSGGIGGSVQRINEQASTLSQIHPQPISLLRSSTAAIATNSTSGLLLLNVQNTLSAIYSLNGNMHTTQLLAGDSGTWFGTSAGSKNINLYYDAGSSSYIIQNTMAAADFTISILALTS